MYLVLCFYMVFDHMFSLMSVLALKSTMSMLNDVALCKCTIIMILL